MVAGHLREKSGYYYAVLNYTDSLGKRKTKWISTGLTVKGNKKRAEAILMDARRNFNPEEPKVMNGDILFADYMEKWLDIIKSSVAVPTFGKPCQRTQCCHRELEENAGRTDRPNESNQAAL